MRFVHVNRLSNSLQKEEENLRNPVYFQTVFLFKKPTNKAKLYMLFKPFFLTIFLFLNIRCYMVYINLGKNREYQEAEG